MFKYCCLNPIRGTILISGFWGLFFHACLALNTSVEAAEREVVIYLANETVPTAEERQNYETIIGWLSSDPSPKTEHIVSSLDHDLKRFQVAVDFEAGDLELNLPRQEALAGAILLTNQSIRSQKCLIWEAEEKMVRETPVSFNGSHENFILAANPVTQSDVLKSVLIFVASKFDPQQHRFVLLIKSHGSGTKLITPRLAVRAEETSRNEILKIANSELSENELPLWTDRLGITKSAFLEILTEAGTQQGMNFSLVFLEACNTMQHEFTGDDLPPNVQQLLLIRDRANYVNILYADVLQRQKEAGSFSQALLTDLPDKFTLIDHDTQPGETTAWWSWSKSNTLFR
ncbi:MAG: hypothetical protein CME32_01200 [Gimesia sp.]|nr:hypothetical protein [Gimesia sp.]